MRQGLGRGLGMGYKNIAPMDSHVHSLSAKGVVTYRKTKSGGDVRVGTNIDGTKNYLFFPTSAYGHERPHQIRTVLKKLGLNAKGDKGKVLLVDRENKTLILDKENIKVLALSEQGDRLENGAYKYHFRFKKDLDDAISTLKAKGGNSDWRKQYLEMETPYDIASHLKHSSIPDSKFNKVQLNKGVRVEMEHTNSKKVAKSIAKAHLDENKSYYKRFNPNKKSKEYLLNAESFIKRYNQDQVISSAREGERMKFQNIKHRDEVFKALKMKGFNVKKRVIKGQLLHPEYVKDYEGEVETGFGNSMYQTMFSTLYVVEVK